MNAADEVQPNQASSPSNRMNNKRSAKEDETVTLGREDVPTSPTCSHRPPLLKKRKLQQEGAVDTTKETTTTQAGQLRRRKLCFNDANNSTFQQTDPATDFPKEYKESDIWYSRDDYEQFLMDRIHTIERLRGNRMMMQPKGMLRMNRGSHGEATAASKQKEEKDKDSQSSSFDHCMRGLEPFQNKITHQDMHSKRSLHKSTIITEQVRQAMFGIKDPERFRFLVAPQSNMALARAQELAAMDEEEVYPQKRRRNSRRSSMSAAVSATAKSLSDQRMDTSLGHYDRGGNNDLSMFYNPAMSRSMLSSSSMLPSMSSLSRRSSMGHNTNFAMPGVASASSSNDNGSLPYPSIFSSSIRQMQEKNAQRLMEMYGKPNGGGEKDKLFRFSVRRDSLLGSLNTGGSGSTNVCKMESMQRQQQQLQLPDHQTLMSMMPMATRFHLRRDSLSHLATK